MKIPKTLLLMLACTLLAAALSACNFQASSKTTITDKDGNIISEEETNFGGDSSEDDSDAEDEGEGETTGTDGAALAAEFAETLQSVFDGNGMSVTLPAPEDQGDGKFVINADENIVFTILTNGQLNYSVTVGGSDQDVRDNAFVVLMGAIANGDDLDQVRETILTNGEESASIPGCTFKVTTLEIAGQPFAVLTAIMG